MSILETTSIGEMKTISLRKAALVVVFAGLVVGAFIGVSGFFGAAMDAQPPFTIGDQP